MKKLILLLPFLLTACVGATLKHPDWIATGPEFSANKGKVEVFLSKDEVKRPFGYVGVITIRDIPAKTDSLKAAIALSQKEAAKHGADAIIKSQNLNEDNPQSGWIMTSYAIKYVDNLTEADKKAEQEFRIVGVPN